jgi:hypothetical protein
MIASMAMWSLALSAIPRSPEWSALRHLIAPVLGRRTRPVPALLPLPNPSVSWDAMTFVCDKGIAPIDTAATLYSPVNAFSTKPLETTTTSAVGAGDSTISVQSTAGGFADAYGVLSIDDELVIYTARGGSQFSGCQRGAFGTTAASHSSGATVRANMVAGFITTLQSAVLAIENDLGTAAARNYVRKDGAVTITGVKTFQDGAEYFAASKRIAPSSA